MEDARYRNRNCETGGRVDQAGYTETGKLGYRSMVCDRRNTARQGRRARAGGRRGLKRVGDGA